MNDGPAISLGEYVGKKLKTASEAKGQKKEKALYEASAALVGTRDLIRKIPDKSERILILRDVNLGVKAEIASYQSQSKVRSLYESILRKLGL